MSKPELILCATPKRGKLIFDNTIDLERYCIEKEGVSQIIELKDEAKLSDKERMYAYLFGPLMAVVVRALTHAGYQGMDNVKARYKMQAEFCKADMIGPNGVEPYLLDLSGMGKSRLLKFIQDIIFELESNYNVKNIPDSSLYKMMKLTGQPFKSVKFKKENDDR